MLSSTCEAKPEKIGILGAGQLSQMLVQASRKIGIPLRVYAGRDSDSAAQEARKKGDVDIEIGSLSNASDPATVKKLREFLTKVPVCGFESELVDCDLLRAASSGIPVRFVPQLEVMEKLSEKLEQKHILSNLGIPSAPFYEFESPGGSSREKDLDSWFDDLQKRFGSSFIVKWSKFGYDGRGVLLVSDSASLRAAKASCKLALSRGTRLYAEERVDFVRELAIIGCHSTNGEVTTYPLVISEQEHGICRRVRGPARMLGVNERFETLAVQYAERIARALPLHGCFGIELFETRDGDLWVNEIAPRVHNSGHYTQDACAVDQFANHLRALAGQMLGGTQTRQDAPFFAMLNLLGPQGFQGKARAPQEPERAPQGILTHWYGKDEAFPGRKLGHLNCVASSQEELTSRIALMENQSKEWESAMLRSERK